MLYFDANNIIITNHAIDNYVDIDNIDNEILEIESLQISRKRKAIATSCIQSKFASKILIKASKFISIKLDKYRSLY